MRLTTLLLVASVIAGSATISTPSCAQTAPPDSATAAPRAIATPPALALIRTGSYVRIETTTGHQVTGVLHEPIGSTVALKRNGHERPPVVERTPVAEVRSTWKAGSNARGGAIAGVVVGGLLGYVASSAISFGAPSEPNVQGLFGGAAIGGLLGALGGALFTNWNLVHESRIP